MILELIVLLVGASMGCIWLILIRYASYAFHVTRIRAREAGLILDYSDYLMASDLSELRSKLELSKYRGCSNPGDFLRAYLEDLSQISFPKKFSKIFQSWMELIRIGELKKMLRSFAAGKPQILLEEFSSASSYPELIQMIRQRYGLDIPQKIDARSLELILDSYGLRKLIQASSSLKDRWVSRMVLTMLDVANLKLILRLKSGSRDFLIPGGTLGDDLIQKLISAKDSKQLAELLEHTPYGAAFLAEDPLKIELGLDGILLKQAELGSRSQMFGPAPIFGYMIKGFQEAQNLSRICTGIQLGIPAQELEGLLVKSA